MLNIVNRLDLEKFLDEKYNYESLFTRRGKLNMGYYIPLIFLGEYKPLDTAMYVWDEVGNLKEVCPMLIETKTGTIKYMINEEY